MQTEDTLILVDANDRQVGTMGKLETHQKALLHRAFSIFVLNSAGEIMLQKRAAGKYHSGGLWTNTCCGHPRNGEEVAAAAHRRLTEEMGFDCALREITTLTYTAVLDRGLTENEFLHVFSGTYDGIPNVNPAEASDWKWIRLDDLQLDAARNPGAYTEWFKIILKRIEEGTVSLG